MQAVVTHETTASLLEYTRHGHKLRLFTLREAQFVTEGIIEEKVIHKPHV